MERIWGFFLHNRQFSYIVLVALLVLGAFSLLSIPRESSPEVRIPVVVITTVFPGASALDVEQLVTQEIEAQLDGTVDFVKKITSTSQEGVSSVVVEFESRADIDKALQEVKSEIDKIKGTLPSDVEDPSITDVNFVDQPIMTVSLVSDLPATRLIGLVDTVSTELTRIPGISKVERSGIPEREVQVIVNQNALNTFGLGVTDVVRAIQTANVSLPAGSIELSGSQYAVSFEGSITDPQEIANIAIVNRVGQPVYVRDVAFVADGVSAMTTYARVSIGGQPSEPAVSLAVYKRSGGDVTRISDAVRARLAELEQEDVLADTPYLITFDSGEFVKEDLKNLSTTALQTILLVMLVLLLTIGWRESLIAGLAIPLSFIIAFIGLYLSGNTINFISLFSLILSVGILVDSAIVITEAVHTKMKAQVSKRQAALDTIKEFHYPLTTGTLTTIAVFAPLFLISGVSGQFIASIPFTIIFVLLASIIVALAFVPLLSSLILRIRVESALEKKQEHLTDRFQNWYRRILEAFLSRRELQKMFLLTMSAAFIFALALPFLGVVKVIFFDQEDIDFLFVEVEKPQGTVLAQTDVSAREVEEIVLEQAGIDSYLIEVGQGSQFGGSGGRDEKLASITMILDKKRENTSTEILESLREKVSVVSSADVRVFQPSNGPPTGSPVAVKFLGDDLDDIATAMFEAERVLKNTPGAVTVDTSNKSDANEFRFIVDRPRISQVGLDVSSIAMTLRTALFGTKATTIKTGSDDIGVVVKLNVNQTFTTPDTTNQATIDALTNMQLTTPNGPVLLGTLVRPELVQSNQVIRRENGLRVGQVSSDVSAGFTVRDVTQSFLEKMETTQLPEGVRMEIGGETEESTQAFKEMGLSMIVGILAVLAILVLQFSSYRYALYIIAIVPLSLIGVFIGLAVSGKALSFPSLMGFIALSGIVVNNAIILIDKMNTLRKSEVHLTHKEVVIEAATSRLRPIILTTVTTVIGIFPLTYASELWSPLAFAIIFGLSFSVFVTLLLVPLLYYRWPAKQDEQK